jgi:hypothetical protein
MYGKSHTVVGASEMAVLPMFGLANSGQGYSVQLSSVDTMALSPRSPTIWTI